MTSAPSISPARPDLERIRWKADASASGYVDGAWWPASRDLAAELPALVTALAGRLDGVERLSFRIDDWEPCPRRVRAGDRLVRMGGFHSQPAGTVLATGERYQGITLLVVPPETDPDAAERILATASSAGNEEDIATLLATPAS